MVETIHDATGFKTIFVDKFLLFNQKFY